MDMAARGTGTNRAIPLKNRLATRQAVPIIAVLACLFGVLLLAGYRFTRDEALDGIRRQTAQLADSVSHYDGYYRSWFAASAAPLVTIFESAGPAIPPMQTLSGTEAGQLASRMLGQRDLIVRTVDANGAYRSLRWARSAGADGGEKEDFAESPAQTRERLEDILAVLGGASGWHAPTADETGREREPRMRYSVPLRYEGKGAVFGALTLTVSMAWFEERVKAFRSLEGCAVFLLAPDGRWTLPEAMARVGFEAPSGKADDAALQKLLADMRSRPAGSTSLSLGARHFITVHTPLSMRGFSLGALIPRAKLLGPLDFLTAMLCLAGALLFGLALFSLHRTALAMLRPLNPLEDLAGRLARGDTDPNGMDGALPPPFSPDEPGRLARSTERLRHALAERLRDLTLLAVTRERLQGEFRLARTIQEGLLPTALPQAEGIAVSAAFAPARDVCGDMYDCFFTASGTVCCLMGNAAARGVPAALLMGRVMPLLRELLSSGLSPAKALENVNRVIAGSFSPAEEGKPLFVTVFAGLFRREDGRLLWASAGQRPPFTSWGESLPWSEDMPLGLRPQVLYRDHEARVPPGGLLFFCNERLPAASSAEGELFGEERVQALVRLRGNDPETLLRGMRSAVLAHCGGETREDLAMLALLRQKEGA